MLAGANDLKSIVNQDVRMAMYSYACHRGGCKLTLHLSAILDIPHIPRMVSLAGILAQVTEYRPRAFDASTFQGKTCRALACIPNLNGFRNSNCTCVHWHSLVIQTVLQVISLVLLVWFNFWFSEGDRDPCFPVDHLVCY